MMSGQNLIGIVLAEIKRLLREDQKSASDLGWSLTRRMLQEILRLPPTERRQLVESLHQEEIGFLLGIAFGGAVEAVRQDNSAFLRDGLLALIIEDRREDPRETVAYLALPNNSAARIGASLEDIFEPLRSLASQETVTFIDTWLREGTKNIGMMGYREATLRDGRFTYKSEH